jgi:hypothetical protein
MPDGRGKKVKSMEEEEAGLKEEIREKKALANRFLWGNR